MEKNSIEWFYSELMNGKVGIAYFGKNGDYKFSHIACPVEVRLFGGMFCTYISDGMNMRRLEGRNTKEAFIDKCRKLEVHPICTIDARPVNEPNIQD